KPKPKQERKLEARRRRTSLTVFLVFSVPLFPFCLQVSSIQNQMQSKGGYGGGMSGNVQMQLVDTKAG
ncbi:C42S2 protein, partial [Psophia crepitans]|nr:C42S2 protein [Psophia crepitans]